MVPTRNKKEEIQREIKNLQLASLEAPVNELRAIQQKINELKEELSLISDQERADEVSRRKIKPYVDR